jgi:nitrite reductase/ring-hydroxylating ferredoxin subunit
MAFVRCAKQQDIPEGNGVVSQIGDKVVAIFKVGGEFFAIGNICPHRGGPLGEGELAGTVVTCPWHGWQFDVTTGCNPENPKVTVTKFPLRLSGDDVLIETDLT